MFSNRCKGEKTQLRNEVTAESSIRWLPNEVLILIFNHLKLVDIKSCRLVCRWWYSCCESASITDKQRYVLNFGILSSEEINEILGNIKRSNIFLELVGGRIKSLDFSRFGRKIKTLCLTECYVPNVRSMINIFSFTPKMENINFANCFYYHLNDSHHTHYLLQKIKFWRAVLPVLRKRNLKFSNVKEFSSGDFDVEDDPWHTFPFETFYQVFPGVIHFYWNGLNLNEMSKRGLLKRDLQWVAGTVVSSSIERKFLKLMPKFEFLETFLPFEEESFLFIDSYSEFFSYQTELVHLSLTFSCQSNKCLPWSTTDVNSEDGKNLQCSAKKIVSYILKNCTKLRTLNLNLNCNLNLASGPADTRFLVDLKFVLVTLSAPVFASNCDIFASRLASFENLKFLYLEYFEAPGIDLFPQFTPSTVYSTLSKILNSLKTGKVLYVHLRNCGTNLFKNGSTEVACSGRIYNDTVEILSIRISHFTVAIVDHWVKIFKRFFATWEFPNLLEFELISERIVTDENSRSDIEIDDKNEILKWIMRIPSLTTVTLHWFCTSITEVIRISKGLPILQKLTYETRKQPSKKEVKEIFRSNCSLNTVMVEMIGTGYQSYKVCRSKNLVYRCCTTESYPYRPYVSL